MFTILACGAVFFPGLFITLRKVLRSTFTRWSDADVVCVSERLVSAIHASLATAAGLVIISSCKDVMTDRHWLVDGFVLFGAPYMAYDIFAMYLSHYHFQKAKGNYDSVCSHSLHTVKKFVRKEWLLILHHLVLLLIFVPAVLFFRGGVGDFFCGCIFSLEFSTPFISFGKIFIQLGLQDGLLHVINGVIVLLSFFICRILIFPYMYWMYGLKYDIPLHKAPFNVPVLCNLGCLTLLAPQLYWFSLLCRKAYRLYQRQMEVKVEVTDKSKSE